MAKENLPICNDKRECGMSTLKYGHKKCTCLHTTYPDGKCPFCKPAIAYTNGKYYPHALYSDKKVLPT